MPKKKEDSKPTKETKPKAKKEATGWTKCDTKEEALKQIEKNASKKKTAAPKKEEQQEEPPKKKASTQRNERGQFAKGCAKPEGSGRKMGTKNKYGNVRDRLREIIMPYLTLDPDEEGLGGKSLATDLMKIDDPNERAHVVASYLPYIVPKFTSTTITADANRPISEEEHLMDMDAKYAKKEISINIKALTIVDNDNPSGDYDPDDDPDFNLDELQ